MFILLEADNFSVPFNLFSAFIIALSPALSISLDKFSNPNDFNVSFAFVISFGSACSVVILLASVTSCATCWPNLCVANLFALKFNRLVVNLPMSCLVGSNSVDIIVPASEI